MSRGKQHAVTMTIPYQQAQWYRYGSSARTHQTGLNRDLAHRITTYFEVSADDLLDDEREG
jgi:hypothetical protein